MNFVNLPFLIAFGLILIINQTVLANQPWPDTSINIPKDFHAFYLSDSSTCGVEIVFKRGLKDTKYDYHVFADYTSSQEVYLQQDVVQDDSFQPFAVVNATADGQRGAYPTGDGYTLTPFTVSTCDNGVKGKVINFVVKAYERGQDPYSSSSQPIWISDPFMVNNNQIVPQGGGVSSLNAKQTDANTIQIQWAIEGQYNVEGFFIIVGKQFTSSLYSIYVPGASSTQTSIQVPGNPKEYAVTVVLYDQNGAVANPTACSQISVQ